MYNKTILTYDKTKIQQKDLYTFNDNNPKFYGYDFYS